MFSPKLFLIYIVIFIIYVKQRTDFQTLRPKFTVVLYCQNKIERQSDKYGNEIRKQYHREIAFPLRGIFKQYHEPQPCIRAKSCKARTKRNTAEQETLRNHDRRRAIRNQANERGNKRLQKNVLLHKRVKSVFPYPLNRPTEQEIN